MTRTEPGGAVDTGGSTFEDCLYLLLDEIDLGPHICNPVYRTLFVLPLSLDNLS